MADTEHNDAGGSSLENRLAEFADGLRVIEASEQAELDALLAQVKTKRDNLSRINHAIRELVGGAQKKPSQAKGKPRKSTLDKILPVLQAEQGVTYRDLELATGLSHDAIARAIAHLRESNIVRHAGMGDDGRRPVFKLMPDIKN